MKRVLEAIDQQIADYARGPLFAFLRDPHIEPRNKLAFAPYVAHFVMTFADLCQHILPEHPPSDELQALVNLNAKEDEGHWEWFLTDLETLGANGAVPYCDAIRRMWQPSTLRTRMLSYRLCHLALSSDSLGKLVLVEAMEAAFKVTIEELNRVSQAFSEKSGKPLYFLGAGHVEAESEHSLDATDVRERIANIQLSEETEGHMITLVTDTVSLFSNFACEMLELSRSASAQQRPANDVRSA